MSQGLPRNLRDERQDRVRDWMLQREPGKLSSSRTWAIYALEKMLALVRALGVGYPEVMKTAAKIYTDPEALANSHAAGEIGIGLLAYAESLGFSGDRLEELALERLLGPQAERACEIPTPEAQTVMDILDPPKVPEEPELPPMPEV